MHTHICMRERESEKKKERKRKREKRLLPGNNLFQCNANDESNEMNFEHMHRNNAHNLRKFRN